MSFIVQVLLKSVKIIENGKVEDVEGINGLSASLFYPKSGVPSVESVRTLRLRDRETLDFTDKPFIERLLFKQEIEGNTFLMVKISAIEKVTKFERAIHKLFGVVAIAAVGTITGIGVVLTAFVKSITSSVFEQSEPKDAITIIGEGAMPIDPGTPEGEFVVQLSVPKDISLKKTMIVNGQEVIKTINIKRGFNNAMVVFDLKRL